MQRRKYAGEFAKLAVFVTMAAVAACTTPAPIDRIAKERGVADGILLDDNGKLTVIEAKSGQVVPSCDELEKTDKKCIHRFPKDQNPTDIKIIRETKIRIVDYVGSTCRTYIDEVTGQEYEVCRPPFTK